MLWTQIEVLEEHPGHVLIVMLSCMKEQRRDVTMDETPQKWCDLHEIWAGTNDQQNRTLRHGSQL